MGANRPHVTICLTQWEVGRAMKRSPLFIILLVVFVDLVGFGLIIPLQAIYADRLHATGLTFGLLVGVYSLMQLIFNPLLGRWSDRVGRRRVLLISIAGSVASHILLGVADLAFSLPLLFLARAFDGITGANIATAQAYIADVTTPENRAKGMGYFGAAFGFGFVVGPALGAGLYYVGSAVSDETYGTCFPAFGAAVISLVALFLVWRYLPESRPDREKPSTFRAFKLSQFTTIFAHPRLRELFTVVFFTIFAFVLLEVTFVYLCLHSLGLGASGTGLVFGYMGVCMVIVQGGLVGRLAKRFGEASLVAVGPIINAMGFLMISSVPLLTSLTFATVAWCVLLLGLIPVTFGHGITNPNLNALISRQAGEDRQGTVLGLSQGVGSLARTIAPPIGGLLYDIQMNGVRGPLPYWVGAGILLLVSVFGFRIRHVQQRSVET